MYKKVILALFMTALMTGGAFALDITGTAPTFPSDPTGGAINKALQDAFDLGIGELRNQFGSIDTKPEKFIGAWGDAGVFASHGATQRAYGGYETVAVTVGPMIGLQLPSSPFTIMDELENLPDKLNREQDLKLGVNPQVLNINVGLNTSKFLLKDLYLGLHLGLMKLDIEGVSFNNFSIGATANYQLVAPVTLSKGLLVWRGLNVGSGIIYQGTHLDYGYDISPIEQDISESGINGKLTITPRLTFDMDVDTVVIPLEANTAVRLLWFLNIPLGLGVDLGFGKSDMRIGMNGKVDATVNGTAATPGSLSVSAGGDVPPTFFNFKIMTGIGLNFGPVIIDIPITLYLDNGFNAGITVGVMF